MAAAPLIDAIDAALPQTQCGKCRYNGCRPYAEAIAAGEAINRCPPGGEATLYRLAELTGQAIQPLEQPPQSPLLAVIREDECIGCTKCIQACPVDAILGAAKQMHTVINDECTGCELCVEPCPVDCIDLIPHPQWQAANDEADQQAYLQRRAYKGRRRFEARNRRLAAEEEAKRARRAQRAAKRPTASASPAPTPSAATASPGKLRVKRTRMVAALKRLERQIEDTQDSSERNAIAVKLAEQQQALADLDRQMAAGDTSSTERAETTGNSPHRHQKRLALNAAEQSLRKLRQQLNHAKRQEGPAEIARVEEQIRHAQQVVDTARATLAAETSS